MTADEILRHFDFCRLAPPVRRAQYAQAAATVSLSEGTTFYREGALEISVSRMDARLASLLVHRLDRNQDRTIRLTHDELAAELGTAREVVSRLLKEFERRGALRLSRGQVTIIDPSMLADLAASGNVLPLTELTQLDADMGRLSDQSH